MSNVFKKKIKYFSPEQIEKVFYLNKHFFETSKKMAGFRMPEPLSFSANELTYEYIEGLGQTFSHELHSGKMWNPEYFYKLGYYLGKLHISMGDLSGKIHLHGDFVPHNIVVNERGVIFFDFEPPGTFDDFDHFYYNRNYVDLTSFIFFIFISHYFKKPWLFFTNKKPFIDAFLEGYTEATEFMFSHDDLLHYLMLERKKWYRERRHSYPKKIVKYVFVRLVVLMQIRIYNVFS